MFNALLIKNTEKLLERCCRQKATIACAESCTGGLLAGLLTEISGASSVFHTSLVCYANQAKINLLGVKESVIRREGAVSRTVALSMVEGLKKRYQTSLYIAITGIAGPSGGSEKKPVGTVFFGLASKNQEAFYHQYQLHGSRNHIREQILEKALFHLNAMI